MTTGTGRCTVHETPQPSICLRCNRDNRDEWGTAEQQPTNERETN